MVIDFADPKEFTFDAGDRLNTNTQFEELEIKTGTLTTSGDTVFVDVSEASTVVLGFKNTGSVTMAAGTIAFECSMNSTNGTDGDWISCIGVRSNANTNEGSHGPTTLTAGSFQANTWKFNVQGMKYFRARCSVSLTTNAIASVILAPVMAPSEPLPATFTHAVTQSGTWTVTNTSTTATAYSVTLAAGTNTANIKNAAGHLFELSASNLSGSTIYVKLYNKASAPTLASDVPIMTIPVAANSFQEINFGAIGKRFSTGISIAVTGAAGATDTTVITAGSYVHASYL